MKVTATVHGFYVKNGKNVYRYLVNGTEKALEAYKEAQGTNFREYEGEAGDKLNGTPLFFSSRPEGKTIELEITASGKVIVAKDVMQVMEQDIMFQDKVQSELAKLAANQQAIRMKLVNAPSS